MDKAKRKTGPAVLGLCALALLVSASACWISQPQSAYTVTGYAEMEIRDYGTLTIALCGEDAPQAVSHFISLAESGAYDGLTFYRVLDGFMIQGGDPSEEGGSDTGEAQAAEGSGLKHTRGAVSLCAAGADGGTNSQFFIVQEDSTYLDEAYAVFGYVTGGMEIVDEICSRITPIDNNGTVAEGEQPVILSVRIS